MKTLTLQGLNEAEIHVKGCGINTSISAVTASKCPGSIVLKSKKNKSSLRIYAIYEVDSWCFALCNTSTAIFEHNTKQTWKDNGHESIEIAVPDDTSIEFEGEFSEEPANDYDN